MTEEAIRSLDQYLKGGGMFEAFNPHTRCSNCTAISTIYGSILWPVDTCFYRCYMFVVLLRLDPIRIFLIWICHMLQTGCSWILCVLDFLLFFQIRFGQFWGKDWTYRFNERKEIFIDLRIDNWLVSFIEGTKISYSIW